MGEIDFSKKIIKILDKNITINDYKKGCAQGIYSARIYKKCVHGT